MDISDASRPRKRARLCNFGRKAHVTRRGAESLLLDVREHGLPEVFSRRSLDRARRDTAELATPFGTLKQRCKFQKKDGAEIDLPIQAPLAMLHFAAEHSTKFASYVEDAYRQHGTSSAIAMKSIAETHLHTSKVGKYRGFTGACLSWA